MGDKRLSKLAMLEGWRAYREHQGSAQDDATLQAQAQRIGYPR